MARTVLFELGTVSDRGVITLTQEGEDVIRAIVMRWIIQAEKGEMASKQLARGTGDPYSANQSAYFRAAGSFLLARLTSHIVSRINIRESLEIITRMKDDQDIPDRWKPLLDHAHTMRDDGGTLDTPASGGRIGGDGHDGVAAVDGGRGRAVDPAAAPAAAPRRDPGIGRKKTRPTAGGKRKKGT